MSALQHDIPDARVLDLFAGSGALGLETLSRGAAHVTFVERASSVVRALQQNVQTLDAAAQVEIVRGDAIRFAASVAPGTFDIALADPPYDTDDAHRLLVSYAEAPFARIFCIEHRTGAALPLPHDVVSKHYGDTTISFLTAPS
jgi:16S rRNA (guanine966-N2)-methyltransferase